MSDVKAVSKAPVRDTATSTNDIAVIILAAGRSARMGEHKLLLPLAGKPLLAWSLDVACASSARPVILTLGRAAEAVTTALPPGPYSTIVNARYAEGMSGSLALAIRQLAPAVRGAIILLGDQPFMPASAIDAVLGVARAQPESIVMGAYGSQRGHPVYLPRRVFAQLLALRDDEGARSVIAREREEVALVTITSQHAMFDVDTLDDYRRAQALASLLD